MTDSESVNALYVNLTIDLGFDFTFDFTSDINFEVDETVELTNDPYNSNNLDVLEWNFVGFQNEVHGTNHIS